MLGHREWRVRGQTFDLSAIPILMGIVNVTPDSFSDGGLFAVARDAVEQGLKLRTEGAAILDIGGESTRPGADPVTADEECARVIPVIEALVERSDAVISIDTTKLEVAREALTAGAHVVNDVSALRFSSGIAALVADHGAGLILMHMRGEPRTMQDDPHYDDLIEDISTFLGAAAREARDRGVGEDTIVLDPGIGFGKTAYDNYRLLAALGRLSEVGYPLVIGHSRKSFLDLEGSRVPDERLPETLAAGLLAAKAGASILRVHDVEAHARALGVLARYLDAREEEGEGQ